MVTLAFYYYALDLELVDLLLLQIGFVQVHDCLAFRIEWSVGAVVKVTDSALESVQIVEVFIGQLVRLLKFLPKFARRILQVSKLGVPVNPECLCEGRDVGEVGDVGRVEVQVLHQHRLHHLLRLLNFKQQMGVTGDVV